MNRASKKPIGIKILDEAGFHASLFGLGLSHGIVSNYSYSEFLNNSDLIDKMKEVSKKLAPLDDGHNKFLESIIVWIDITAPRFWWQEFDTYRVGVTKQSESTMHTLVKKELNQDNFVIDVPEEYLDLLNAVLDNDDLGFAKAMLPEGFLQRRVVCTNYKTLRTILKQRKNHKLPAWKVFCKEVYERVFRWYYLKDIMGDKKDEPE